MLRAKRQHDNGKGYNYNLYDKANDAFHDKYGTRYDYNENNYNNGGGNSNTIRGGMLTRVGLDGGHVGFNQSDLNNRAYRYHQKNYGEHALGDIPNNSWGNKQNYTQVTSSEGYELSQTQNQRYLPMSQSFKQKIQDIDNDMNDFYSGNYENRLNQKRQQMRNK